MKTISHKSRIQNGKSKTSLRVERLEERTVLSSFAVSFGGAGDDYPRPAGATDPLENSYLTGRFSSQPADFDPGPGVVNLSSVGDTDVFVAKYRADGSLAWAQSFGGPGADTGVRTEFAREVGGDFVYVAGTFRNTIDFGAAVGTLTSAGEWDTFVLKLDAHSGVAVWAIQLAGPGLETPADLVAVDGRTHLVGTFTGTADFDPGPGLSPLDSASGANYVWSLDEQGNYVSAWQSAAFSASIVVQGDSTYLRGQFTGTVDFDHGPGVESRTSTGSNNLWVGKYSSAGELDWVQSVPISVNTSGTMAHDASALYIATTDWVQSASTDVFVASFNKSDGSINWSKRFGSTAGYEAATTCVVDPQTGALYIAGSFTAPLLDFNAGGPGGKLSGQGNSDGFVVKLQSATGNYQNAWHIGGAGYTEYARVHDVRGSKVYVSSSFAGPITFPSGQSFNNNYANDGYLLVIDEADALPPSLPATKFYVVDDAAANKTYEYAGGGAAVETYSINSGNSAPRGAASTAACDKVWVADANKRVYVYNTSGGLLGSWNAGSLPGSANVQGITVSGVDVWIVDAKSDKVYRYAGAASRLSGSQNAASSFSLNISNRDPSDLVTDGASIWVLNNSTVDRVFKYTVSGTLLGYWDITNAGGSPTGITIDPTNVRDIWIVDSATDRVYPFANATNLTSGFQNPGLSFPLAPGNTNPQGIADPPASVTSKSSSNTSFASNSESIDSALLAIVNELDGLLAGSKKRR